jgi:hypothetical protein
MTANKGESYIFTQGKEKLFLFLIIAINLIIKVIPASILELGNDEVYYWTYAMFPDWSHFDHPPMVGLTIQLFTLNLAFSTEFWMRLGPLILSSCNIILLFYLVKRIYSVRAAFISVLLFTASFYFNIISGLFILPDTPQIFFVMLSLYFGIPAILNVHPVKEDSYNIILFGLFSGLAFLSKYHSLFLWVGFGLYVITHNRQWLRRPSFYISLLITLILMIPVIYWNIENNFISFTFHGSRVGLFNSPLNPDSFLQFNLGQFLYQNPVLFILFIVTLVSLFRKKRDGLTNTNILLLYLSLPLILIFTLFSLFKNTFPHWSGPAFIGLIMLSSEWLNKQLVNNRKKVLAVMLSANALIVLILIFAPLQINYGLFNLFHEETDPQKLGENDVTLDMFGWKQAGAQFHLFLKKEGIEEKDHHKVKIISNKWFPAAHIDFYIAHPLKIDVMVSGPLGEAHKYFWINRERSIHPDDKVYYITTSQQFCNPDSLDLKFSKITPKDTLKIKRNGKTVKNLFIYEMGNLLGSTE